MCGLDEGPVDLLESVHTFEAPKVMQVRSSFGQAGALRAKRARAFFFLSHCSIVRYALPAGKAWEAYTCLRSKISQISRDI